jgi:hypothetical protein
MRCLPNREKSLEHDETLFVIIHRSTVPNQGSAAGSLQVLRANDTPLAAAIQRI